MILLKENREGCGHVLSALKNGLKLEKELGVNPYKFGMIGSTDTHTSLSTAYEDNFFGVSYIRLSRRCEDFQLLNIYLSVFPVR